MVVLSIIVVYDAFVYKTPLYYIGFFFLGALLGRIYKRTVLIEFEDESGAFKMNTGIVYIVITIVLIILRFTIGKRLLQAFDVKYASDALYLLFIGIYYSRWRILMEKIDNLVYKYADDRFNAEKGNSDEQ
jgi:hypothetical protein